ncbi:hypothetical protein AL486_07095 [Pandoraea apista]|uniref:hypothetical protein n=1 Tax=Pandoraea apista TaxID=93218 RepID=UPI000CE98377|nr:hypothetical protein [Pandoraea apista]AVF39500.1 hypothetical protein AL486_07095 [Pandoraea apista]
MSKEFVGAYLFLDSLNKNSDLQRKQQEINRLKGEVQRQKQQAINATAFPGAGMVNRADYERLKEKIDFYEELLAGPLNVIADAIPKFKETYRKEQLLLSSWIVSQKAFKETAMKYGQIAGKTRDEIYAEGIAAEEDVLNGTTKFGNNIETSQLANEYKDELRKYSD